MVNHKELCKWFLTELSKIIDIHLIIYKKKQMDKNNQLECLPTDDKRYKKKLNNIGKYWEVYEENYNKIKTYDLHKST